MGVYLEPTDDGLPMRDAGSWAEEKLDYLTRYIWAFETSMREKPWRGRYYIDLMAGPGKNRVRETGNILLGSPLLALTTEFPFTRYHFAELDQDYVRALSRRCSESPLSDRVRIHSGDANVVTDEIVREIEASDRQWMPSHWHNLCLAFIDPEGFEIEWETVAKLARMRKMDLIVNFPIGGMNRFMPTAIANDAETAIDSFFGGREWRGIYLRFKDSPRLARELLNLYRSNLVAMEYKVTMGEDTGDEVLIRNSQRNTPMYYLMFASKHDLGNTFWKQITRRNVRGQMSFDW